MPTGPFAQNRSISRRDALLSGIAVTTLASGLVAAESPVVDANNSAAADDRRQSPKQYSFRKSINLWAFPYPQRMNLRECLLLAKQAGFDGIELNYDLENDLSPLGQTTIGDSSNGGRNRYRDQRLV